jgi:hypothetical protein
MSSMLMLFSSSFIFSSLILVDASALDRTHQICDESKCRSPGPIGSNIRFDCYTTNPIEPPLCSDGYEGRFVDKISTTTTTTTTTNHNNRRRQEIRNESFPRQLDEIKEEQEQDDDNDDTIDIDSSCKVNVRFLGCPKQPVFIADYGCLDSLQIITFRYMGNGCVEFYPGQQFTCTDSNGGPTASIGSQSYIVVTQRDGNDVYFLGPVKVDETFTLNANKQFKMLSTDIIISIYQSNIQVGKTPTEANLLQRVSMHLLCPSAPLDFYKKIGASRLESWIEITDRKVPSEDHDYLLLDQVTETESFDVAIDTFDSKNSVRLLEMTILTNIHDELIDYSSKVEDKIIHQESEIGFQIFKLNYDPKDRVRYTFYVAVTGETLNETNICNDSNLLECEYGLGTSPVLEEDGYSTIENNYYTCCPKDYIGDISRHCSNPEDETIQLPSVYVIGDSIPIDKCGGDPMRVYERQMDYIPFYPTTTICCDSIDNRNTTSLSQYEEIQDTSTIDDCDESRCISEAFFPFTSYSGYNCLGGGNNTLYPFRCNDGYVGRPITTEYPTWVDEYGFALQYYTCCPPNDPQQAIALRRHCSDPIEIVGENSNQICVKNSTLKYARQMEPYYYGFSYNSTSETPYSQFQKDVYVCCDNLLVENETADFLDEVDCVPQCFKGHLRNYIECIVSNSYGKIQAMTCDYSDAFPFPRQVYTKYAIDSENSWTLYDCCKTESQGPFVQDFAFYSMIYPFITISAFAVIFSFVLIAGLSLSILKQWRSSSADASSSSMSFMNGYNGYNSYLVLLALPDMILNLFLVGLYGSYANQTYSPKFAGHIIYAWTTVDTAMPLDTAMVQSCTTANCYINCVVAYEIFVLLKKSSRRQKHTAPSLCRAIIQGTVVYTFSLIVFFLHYFLIRKDDIPLIVAPFLFLVSVGIPLLYLGYVCFMIWWHNLMPSLERRTKELVFFFFRIIMVFLLIYIPALIFLSVTLTAGTKRSRDYLDHMRFLKDPVNPHFQSLKFLLALQPILSTCMALTKTDVRQSVYDFITFSDCRRNNIPSTSTYVRRNRQCEEEEEKMEEQDVSSSASITLPTSTTFTLATV